MIREDHSPKVVAGGDFLNDQHDTHDTDPKFPYSPK